MAEVIEVRGLRELEAQLLALGEEYGEKAAISPVMAALRKAGKVVQETAQSIVHRKSGTLANNIIVTKTRRPPPGEIGVRVTVRAKAKGYKSNSRNIRSGKVGLEYNFYGPLFYGSFLEFGTSPSKKRPWKTAPYPYMRPAFDRNKSTLPGLIRDELSKAIERSVKRLSKSVR